MKLLARSTSGLILIIALLSYAAPIRAEPGLAEARQDLIKCIHENLEKYRAKQRLTVSGVAYFVGLSCAGQREIYRKALVSAGLANDAELIRETDQRMVEYIVDTLMTQSR